MGFIYKLTKDLLINPVLEQMRKEVREENKRYDKMMEQAEQNILLENEYNAKHAKTIEVHQPYDPIIHEHEFW